MLCVCCAPTHRRRRRLPLRVNGASRSGSVNMRACSLCRGQGERWGGQAVGEGACQLRLCSAPRPPHSSLEAAAKCSVRLAQHSGVQWGRCRFVKTQVGPPNQKTPVEAERQNLFFGLVGRPAGVVQTQQLLRAQPGHRQRAAQQVGAVVLDRGGWGWGWGEGVCSLNQGVCHLRRVYARMCDGAEGTLVAGREKNSCMCAHACSSCMCAHACSRHTSPRREPHARRACGAHSSRRARGCACSSCSAHSTSVTVLPVPASSGDGDTVARYRVWYGKVAVSMAAQGRNNDPPNHIQLCTTSCADTACPGPPGGPKRA